MHMSNAIREDDHYLTLLSKKMSVPSYDNLFNSPCLSTEWKAAVALDVLRKHFENHKTLPLEHTKEHAVMQAMSGSSDYALLVWKPLTSMILSPDCMDRVNVVFERECHKYPNSGRLIFETALLFVYEGKGDIGMDMHLFLYTGPTLSYKTCIDVILSSFSLLACVDVIRYVAECYHTAPELCADLLLLLVGSASKIGCLPSWNDWRVSPSIQLQIHLPPIVSDAALNRLSDRCLHASASQVNRLVSIFKLRLACLKDRSLLQSPGALPLSI